MNERNPAQEATQERETSTQPTTGVTAHGAIRTLQMRGLPAEARGPETCGSCPSENGIAGCSQYVFAPISIKGKGWQPPNSYDFPDEARLKRGAGLRSADELRGQQFLDPLPVGKSFLDPARFDGA